MKNTFKILPFILIALICCSFLTSCNKSDAEITDFSFGYLTASAYNNGRFSEESITKQIDSNMETVCYMVIDFKVKAPVRNKGEHSIKIATRVSDGSALAVSVQEAPTGKFETAQNKDGSTSYTLTYSVPESKKKVKEIRTILQLTPTDGGETKITVSVSGAGETVLKGQATENKTFYAKTLNLDFTLQSDNSYAVSGIGTCVGTDIVIPGTYQGQPVKAIAANAFQNHTEIKSISIPASVTGIDPSAFYGCSSKNCLSLFKTHTRSRRILECRNEVEKLSVRSVF